MLGVMGDLVRDVLVRQLEPPRPATDTRVEITVTRGGSAANVAAFAGPRYPTRFIGCVGDDPEGQALRQELASHGVDVRLQMRGHTGIIVVIVDPTGERSMYPARNANALLMDIDPAWLTDIELLHLTGYSLESGTTPQAVLAAADSVHRAGGQVSFDVSSIGVVAQMGLPRFLELMDALAPDIISANAAECAGLDLAHGTRPGATLARFPGAILLARAGGQPTAVFQNGHLVEVVNVDPAPDVRDLTGAGDAFNAGFLTDYLGHGWSPRHNVQAAHRLAARVVSCVGATEPGPIG